MGKPKAVSDETLTKKLAEAAAGGSKLAAQAGGAVAQSIGASGAKPVKGRCYETHPGLLIAEGLPLVYGGSCGYPVVTDADVYVGFDGNMKQTFRAFPWKKGTEFLYHIADMNPPKDEASFVKMLKWVAAQLEKGAKVHAGCIGGHGRTGLFFAALRHHVTQDADAIEYVRKHYCKKAVESESQMDFLAKLGLKKAKPTKVWAPLPASTSYYSGGNTSTGYVSGGGMMISVSKNEERITPIPVNGNVWGLALDEV